MSVYYNENDPRAVAWQGSIVDVKTILNLLVGSSSCQSGHGKLGTEPKHDQATCSFSMNAIGLISGVLACVQHRGHDFRRMIGMILAHRDWCGKSESGSCQVNVFAWSFPYKLLPSVVCVYGNFAPISHYLHAGTRRNIATCCSGQALCQSLYRIFGNCVDSLVLLARALSPIAPCIAENSISYE